MVRHAHTQRPRYKRLRSQTSSAVGETIRFPRLLMLVDTWINPCSNIADGGWQYAGNVLGGTIATDPATWGKVKDGFRK